MTASSDPGPMFFMVRKDHAPEADPATFEYLSPEGDWVPLMAAAVFNERMRAERALPEGAHWVPIVFGDCRMGQR